MLSFQSLVKFQKLKGSKLERWKSHSTRISRKRKKQRETKKEHEWNMNLLSKKSTRTIRHYEEHEYKWIQRLNTFEYIDNINLKKPHWGISLSQQGMGKLQYWTLHALTTVSSFFSNWVWLPCSNFSSGRGAKTTSTNFHKSSRLQPIYWFFTESNVLLQIWVNWQWTILPTRHIDASTHPVSSGKSTQWGPHLCTLNSFLLPFNSLRQFGDSLGQPCVRLKERFQRKVPPFANAVKEKPASSSPTTVARSWQGTACVEGIEKFGNFVEQFRGRMDFGKT